MTSAPHTVPAAPDDDGPRPMALTALALGNLVFGGIGALTLMGMYALWGMAQGSVDTTPIDAELLAKLKPAVDVLKAVSNPEQISAVLSLGTLATGLELVSSWGLLMRRRFWGRTVANTFALCAIAANLGFSFVMPVEIGGGVGLSSLLGLAYPLLTLALLNGPLRRVLIR